MPQILFRYSPYMRNRFNLFITDRWQPWVFKFCDMIKGSHLVNQQRVFLEAEGLIFKTRTGHIKLSSVANSLPPLSLQKELCFSQARSQDLEKEGDYFERVRSVQTTLTRIFIDLESVSDGLSEIWDEMSRKFKGFFRPKLGDLQKKKKKKVFAKIKSDFSAEIQNSNVFSAQN